MSRHLESWGRYPFAPQTGHPCNWREELPAELTQIITEHGSTLAYGNGRSYGDSCLAHSNQVLHTRTLNRFISTDWEHGRIVAEAGVTLAEILQIAIPRGWFLPVTPGTQYVTLGGAIANDVHGKNHHRKGTFGNHVRSFELLRSQQTPLVCSLGINPELFAATIGGLGLTGMISWAEISLMPITSGQINSTTVRFGGLAEFFELSAELDHQHEYSVAWVDCLATGKKSGRGVFIAGDHACDGELEIRHRRKMTMPLTPPVSLINNLSLRTFNTAYWYAHPNCRTLSQAGFESFFYPLDRILQWNRVYGRKGFQQYQCVIPDSVAEVVTAELLKVIASSGQGSFLAVLKRCGDIASPGLLSFPMPGTSLALDFPQSAELEHTLFPRLDKIVHQAGGRLYPAKDAHMTGHDFRQAYPGWEQLEVLRDPGMNSRFWTRVTT